MAGIHHTPLNLSHPRAARAWSPRHRAHRRSPRTWAVEWLEGRTLLSGAQPLTFSVNLQTGVGDAAVPPYITYQSPIRDANGDGWDEAVLKITLDGSPYNLAMFQVQYTATPSGDVNVNIGDSSADDTGGGDAGTQSNDSEVHVGRGGGVPTTMWAYGSPGGGELAQVPNFAANGVTATFVVRNNFVSWDNSQGVSGSLSSPYLFALAGQPDSEGPVNYDIYAAFNKAVAGDYRFGTGVGQVTVTLSSSADTTPPTTTADLSGTEGGAGWYVGPVTATLSASDPDDDPAALVTTYSVDYGPTNTYEPAQPIVVSGDGLHTIRYQSRDPAGNVESLRTQVIRIGQPPAVNQFIVTNLNDSGEGSLRQAIVDSNNTPGQNEIDFVMGLTGTITLHSALPDLSVTTGLTEIHGPGASTLTVARSSDPGTPAFRIFTIDAGVKATLDGVTIEGGYVYGYDTGGGGVRNDGTLTVSHSILDNNFASLGGGIYNDGILTVSDSTISDNHTSAPGSSSGGGIYNVGGDAKIVS
jgi:hypothetical protein